MVERFSWPSSIMKKSVDTFKILSLDPGTTFTGYGLIEAKIDSLEMVAAKAWTVDASKHIDTEAWNSCLYGERFARVKKHGVIFRYFLKKYNPLIVVCESPFYNPRRPNAYGALLEIVLTVREVLYNWDKWMDLYQIDPATAKKSIGVAGNSGDKSLVKKKLLELKEFKDIGLEDFDEHSADALLIAKCQLDKLKASSA